MKTRKELIVEWIELAKGKDPAVQRFDRSVIIEFAKELDAVVVETLKAVADAISARAGRLYDAVDADSTGTSLEDAATLEAAAHELSTVSRILNEPGNPRDNLKVIAERSETHTVEE